MTSMNAHDLPALLELMREEGAQKFYFSHLNYAGRGNIHRGKDAHFTATREALDLLFERAWQAALDGLDEDYVTGNNDADGAYLLQWVQRRLPRWHADLRARLQAWGGNSSGVRCGQHRQPGPCAPRHHVVAPRPGQRARAAVLGHLG